MSFTTYLTESDNDQDISLDDFIQQIKSKGLFGYNIFKHISEEDLKKILEGDLKESLNESDNSLAVRLGLKKEDDKTDSTSDAENKEDEKPKPLSFSDRIKLENEKRKQEQQERAEKEARLNQEKLKSIEDNSPKIEPTFGNASLNKQQEKDAKTVDKINSTNDKKLTNSMFSKNASVSTDKYGYKKVDNLSKTDDKNANNELKKEMDKKFPTQQRVMSRSEYSKRTLLAIADRMDFDVYCKFRKANGQIRTTDRRARATLSVSQPV